MRKDIILSGVGGQGILTIATIIGEACLLYTSLSPRDPKTSRMPSSA